MVKKILIILLLLSCNTSLYAQLSDMHFFPPLKQNTNSRSIEQQAFYISTPETTAFTVQIFRGNSLTPLTTYSISNTAPAKYDLANGNNDITLINDANTGVVISNSGLRFQSTGGEKFYVNYRGRCSAQAASLTLKGRKALGTTFKWGGIPNRAAIGNNTNLSATLGIMATEDNTSVTISNYDPNCVFRLGANPQGITDNTITKTLNKGESFVLEAVIKENAANSTGWLGASIVSNNKIAISNGNLNSGVVANDSRRDSGIDQPVPEVSLGKEYIFIRGNGTDQTEFPIIIATQNETQIFVNGATAAIATINEGDYFEIPGNNYSSANAGANMYVKTSKEVYAYQVLAGAPKIQTIGLNFIAPVNCLLPNKLDNISDFKDVAGLDFNGGGVTIIASTATPDTEIQVKDSTGNVALPVAIAVTGNLDWKTFYITNIDGNVSVESTGPIAVGFLGANAAAGIAGYFSGFDTIPIVELDIAGSTCIPGAELLEVTGGFESYQWFLNGVAIPGATSNSYFPTESGSYFVQINKFGCLYDSQSLDVESIIINPTEDMQVCDDTVNNDGSAIFDLESQTTVILGTQDPLENIVTYHLSADDAEQGINPLTSPYTNISNPQPIYVRLERIADNRCKNISATPTFNLIVNTSEDSSFNLTPNCSGAIATITGTTGGIFAFNTIPTDGALIEPNTGTITNATHATTYTVIYTTQGACSSNSIQSVTTLSLDDASFTLMANCSDVSATITGNLGGVFTFNPIPTDGALIDANTGAITNVSPNTTYTVEYTTQGSCATVFSQNVTTKSIPDSNSPSNYELCDDIDSNEATLFDLSIKTNEASGGNLNYTVSYHISLDDANSGLNDLPTSYTNTSNPQTIYVRVEDATTNCFSIENFNLIVTPLPLVNDIENYVVCDDNDDNLYDFDLESKTEEVLNEQDPTIHTVTYHETLAEAQTATNPLTSPYTNTQGNPQKIYANITNTNTTCSNITSFDIEVQNAIANQNLEWYELCDDNVEFDDDTTNDNVEFDLSSQIPSILNGQNPTNFTVSFYTSLADANSKINALAIAYTNTINPQIIYARVDNDTMIDNGSGTPIDSSSCYEITELTLMVNPIPIINLNDQIICVDNGETPQTITTGLNTNDYSFEWYLDGILLENETNGIITPANSGTYNIIVTNNNTGCSTLPNDPNTFTKVTYSSAPTLNLEQISLPFIEDNTILATAGTISGINTEYEFNIDNGQWVTNGTNTYTFENVSAGEHIITVRDLNGCGETSLSIIIIDYIPYFTPNGDGYHDTWNILGAESIPDAKIYIFNRFGKLLKDLNPLGKGWNGVYNNKILPTSDYWFVVNYKDPNNNEDKVFKAHFTLKR